MNSILNSLELSFLLAVITTIILLILCIPFAYWLTVTQSWLKHPLTIITTLPIVLPPTVLGYYLLLLMGSHGFLGKMWFALTGVNSLAFTFPGLVIGSVIYSMPFAVQPLQSAFENNSKKFAEIAMTLGASPLDRFFSIILPLAKRGILTATILSFAHTIGEFGVVLIIGGNIPNKTSVASVTIYQAMIEMNYQQVNILSLILIIISILVLSLVLTLNKKAAANLLS